MDKADKKLLSPLKINARTAAFKLARQLDMARSIVRSRIKRLEDKGVIPGYNKLLTNPI